MSILGFSDFISVAHHLEFIAFQVYLDGYFCFSPSVLWSSPSNSVSQFHSEFATLILPHCTPPICSSLVSSLLSLFNSALPLPHSLPCTFTSLRGFPSIPPSLHHYFVAHISSSIVNTPFSLHRSDCSPPLIVTLVCMFLYLSYSSTFFLSILPLFPQGLISQVIFKSIANK